MARIGAMLDPKVFKAYDIRGIYPEHLGALVAPRPDMTPSAICRLDSRYRVRGVRRGSNC